jgi:hypothetical protein
MRSQGRPEPSRSLGFGSPEALRGSGVLSQVPHREWFEAGRYQALKDVVGTQCRRPGGASIRGMNAPHHLSAGWGLRAPSASPCLQSGKPAGAEAPGLRPLPTPPGVSLLPAHPEGRGGWGSWNPQRSSGTSAGAGSGATVAGGVAPHRPSAEGEPLAPPGWAPYRSRWLAGAKVQGDGAPPRVGSWPLLPSRTPDARNNTGAASARCARSSETWPWGVSVTWAVLRSWGRWGAPVGRVVGPRRHPLDVDMEGPCQVFRKARVGSPGLLRR